MYLTLDWSLLSKACLKISLLWSEGKRAGRGKIFKHLWLRSWHKAWMEVSIKDNFKITERILAGWLVESYGLWDFRPWNDLTCHAVPVVLIFRKINVIVKKKKIRPQFSMVYTLVDHRKDAIKCSKPCSETTRLRLVVPLEFWTFYAVISMVYRSVDHGKLWSIF